MKRLPLVIIVFITLFITIGCTTTTVTRIDGEKKFTASNTSWGWDRKDLKLKLIKKNGKLVIVEIGIGESGGSAGLDRAITGLENTLQELNDLKP